MANSSNTQFTNKQSDENSGQGLVEYALILVLVAIVVIAVLFLLGPVIGNVFSEINSSLGTETPQPIKNPPQPAVFTLVGGTAYPRTTELKMGYIEVLGIPQEMQVDTDLIVKVIITPDSPTVTITIQPTPSQVAWEIPSFFGALEIYPRMSAALYGAGFEIEPEGKLEQRTDIGVPTEWSWTVSPKKLGNNLALNLEITVPVEVRNVYGNLEESYNAVANYPFNVRVLGKTGLTSHTETVLDWIVRILGLGIAAAILNGLFSFGKARYRRIMNRSINSKKTDVDSQTNTTDKLENASEDEPADEFE